MGVDFIEFPKLGIRLNISPIAFSIPLGPDRTITVHWYGIIIATAIMVAFSLAMRHSKKFNIKEDDLIDMFLMALPISIISARLFFVVFTWDMYKNDLLGIFRVWEGGLAIYGAIIGAVISVFIFSRMRKIDMLYLCDFACVYLPLAQAIGRWGNFTNQELYGRNTDLPWGMTGNRIQAFPDPGVDGSKLVHPTFLYESLLNLIVFTILIRLRKRNKVKGSVFATYLMSYSFIRFLMEFIRVDEFGTGSIRYNQVIAAMIFFGALIWLLWLVNNHKKDVNQGEEELAPSAYSEVLHSINDEEDNKNNLSESSASAEALNDAEAREHKEE